MSKRAIKIGHLGLAPCDEVDIISYALKKKIGFDKHGLIKSAVDSKFSNTIDVILLDLVDIVLGNKNRKDLETYNKIKKNMGFNKKVGLIGDSSHDSQVSITSEKGPYFVADNALFVVYCAALNKKKEAKELLKNIENHFGFDEKTNLIKTGSPYTNALFSFHNVCLASAYFALSEEQGLALMDSIDIYFGKNKFTHLVRYLSSTSQDWLDKSFEMRDDPTTRIDTSALHASNYFNVSENWIPKANELFDNTERYIKRDRNGLIYDKEVNRSGNIESISTQKNLAVAFLYMTKQFYDPEIREKTDPFKLDKKTSEKIANMSPEEVDREYNKLARRPFF